MMECLILLMYLEDPRSFETEKFLQECIGDIVETVNEASDITGIHAGGLYAGMWGEDPVVSFFVQHDTRYEGKQDQMIRDVFEKALELNDLEELMWVMEREDRELLDHDEDPL